MDRELPALVWDHESVRVLAPAKQFTVYFIREWDGALVYSGATAEPRRRFHEHLRNEIPGAYVEMQKYRTAAAMEKAEAEAEAGYMNTERGKRNGAWGTRPRTSGSRRK